MPVYLYVLKRLLIAIPTLLVVSFLSFAIMRYDIRFGPVQVPTGKHAITLIPNIRLKNPIDPLAELKQNPQISPAARLHEAERLGLDKPFMVQYWTWLTHALRGDLGTSFTGENVSTILAQRIPNTLMLNLVTLIITWLVALPLGVYAALRWRTLSDSAMTLFSSVGMAAPSFVVALLLAFFAVQLGWPPVGGIVGDEYDFLPWYARLGDLAVHLILPVTVLTIGSIAGLQRQMRGNLLDVLEAEYVRVARAKGLPESQVIYRHAVRTAINPLVTLLGFEFAGLLSGSALVEMVLRYPGLGYTALEAVRQSDTNLAMTVLTMAAALLILGNLLGDILLKIVDPRIELA